MTYPGIRRFVRNPQWQANPGREFSAEAIQHSADPLVLRDAVAWLTALGEQFDFDPTATEPGLISGGFRMPPGSWIVAPSWPGGVIFMSDAEFRAMFVPAAEVA